jgi:hypothetical protein
MNGKLLRSEMTVAATRLPLIAASYTLLRGCTLILYD